LGLKLVAVFCIHTVVSIKEEFKKKNETGVVVAIYDCSTKEAETGRL
jgi:hypothetical protein